MPIFREKKHRAYTAAYDMASYAGEPTDHPLAIEQREGVTVESIKQIAEELCDEEKQ